MDLYRIYIRNTRTNTPVLQVDDFDGLEVSRNTAVAELARLGDRYRAGGIFTVDADLVLATYEESHVVATAPLS